MTFQKALRALVGAAALAIAFAAQGAVPLAKYNVDKTQTTVSGLSSGGFMANQLGYAHSSLFKGVAVFAGGPYMCAGHNNYTACMYNASISSAMLTTMQNDINAWSGNQIDAKSNVAGQKVYMFVGTSDFTVGPNPMNAVQTQYTNNGVAAANLSYVQRASTAHVFPTDFDATGNNACNSSSSPYISNCGYDGAKAMFEKFYGTLNARNNAPAAGNYIQFDQTPYIAGNPGMSPNGWLYVPANCASGAQCKVHVALHGCQQNYDTIGDKYVKNTGITRWADTNSIIVLFPQTKVDSTSRQTSASGSLGNPNGCWDWIGWYGTNFSQKAGTQVAAIKAMVDQVSSGTGGGGGGGTLPAPTGVATSGATNTTMNITWGAVTGASGYNVFRNGGKVNGSLVAGTSFTDSGLAAGTTYSWSVAAVDSAGTQGAMSSSVNGTTTGATPVCYTANNYNHTVAGRAHQSGGYAYANGSNQNMGLWNVYTVTTLKQTGTNYYVIGTCP
ncbi:extracellular catalytic domain type 2 short-chain-length polyhydroxyalkanoate depolymerase [Ramlibacter sp. PS4R-6]|uniref:extracellular catalytic domain type 2 short-chain-length polyhydroxyalkanoate depolymerase n=1 Tax=Ramlibacter sp. PS4R-6 TaxID=3133438 RepID=UPI00309FD301